MQQTISIPLKAFVIPVIAIVSVSVIASMIFFGERSGASGSDTQKNVSIVDGTQIVEIRAKGGYTPRRSTAQAGIPTRLKIDTKGTFDCSSVLRIPSLNITKNLPPSGLTYIDLGSQNAGTLYGTCGMGMYPFEIEFKS